MKLKTVLWLSTVMLMSVSYTDICNVAVAIFLTVDRQPSQSPYLIIFFFTEKIYFSTYRFLFSKLLLLFLKLVARAIN